jgi:hypothetical protein
VKTNRVGEKVGGVVVHTRFMLFTCSTGVNPVTTLVSGQIDFDYDVKYFSRAITMKLVALSIGVISFG